MFAEILTLEKQDIPMYQAWRKVKVPKDPEYAPEREELAYNEANIFQG